MNKEKTKQLNKKIIFKMDDSLYEDMKSLKQELGINWSFQIRQLVKEKIEEIKAKQIEKKE